MDYKKDTNYKGLVSQQSTGGTSPVRGSEGSQLASGSNGMEAFSITLSKKCERLATAVYLVTNFLLDTEPLKIRLRTLSLDFVRDVSFARIGGHTTEGHNFDVLKGNVLETLALLELAFISGLLSEMNFTILKREYAALRDAIEIKKASHESRTDNILGETFFGSTFHTNEQAHKDIFDKGHNNNSMSFTMSERNNNVRERTPKPVESSSKMVLNARTPVVRAASNNADKEARRSRILKLIKDSHEVMVKDITVLFPDLSEKTLQRELVALVESGVLKKTGERRWSRYSLV